MTANRILFCPIVDALFRAILSFPLVRWDVKLFSSITYSLCSDWDWLSHWPKPPSSDSRNPFYHDPATWYANKTPPPPPPTPPYRQPRSSLAVAAVDVSDAELVPLVVFDIRLETVKYSVPSNYNQVKVDNNSQVSSSFWVLLLTLKIKM
jgi:hypothetical protein